MSRSIPFPLASGVNCQDLMFLSGSWCDILVISLIGAFSISHPAGLAACSDTMSPWSPRGPVGRMRGRPAELLGQRPRALAGLVSHSLCSLGPITGGAWQGNEEEVSATAGSECSSVVGKFEEQPGWEEQDLIDRVSPGQVCFTSAFWIITALPTQGGPEQSPLLPNPSPSHTHYVWVW